MNEERVAFNRRRFFECLSAMGLGSTLMPDALVIAAQDADTVTIEMIEAAQKIAGVSFTRSRTTGDPDAPQCGCRTPGRVCRVARRQPWRRCAAGDRVQSRSAGQGAAVRAAWPDPRAPDVSRPSTDEALAFLPVTHLARLVETRQVKPSELTELYLSRLAKYDPILHCVVSLTSELARAQAREADDEIAAGSYRGPLHGIPFGLKDLFAVRGTKNHVGCLALERPGHRHRRHRLHEAEGRGRDHGREVVDRSPRCECTVVRWPDT